MKYCHKYLHIDTRLDASFEKSTGVCTLCNYHDSLDQLDWQERFEILLDLIKDYKNKSNDIFEPDHRFISSYKVNSDIKKETGYITFGKGM